MGRNEVEETPIQLEAYQPTSNIGTAVENDVPAANTNNATSGDSSVTPVAAAGNVSTSESSSTDGQVTTIDAITSSDSAEPIQLLSRGAYNGEIEANETVVIVPEIAAMVLDIQVNEGDWVEAGEMLVRLDTAILDGQQAQAIAALKAAQAQLDQLLAPVDADNLEAAQAAVNAAAVAYREAANGPGAEDLQIAESQVRQAEAAVRAAQAAYNEVKGNPRIGMLPQSVQLEQVTLALEAVNAQYQKVAEGAPAEAIAGAYARLVQARTQLANLEEGAKPEQIRAAEAQVEMAEAGLYLSTIQLVKASIVAPMDGIVISKNVSRGSMAAPGTPLLTLMSTDVNVTIPVEESRMADLAIGQSATIQVNAYPDRVFEGEIIRIAPQLNAATRTVKVTIRPTDDDDKLLAPGMFATVDLLN